MTTVAQDIEYPLAGDAVRLTATDITAGTRVRWRVTAVPPGSGVAVYSGSNKVWLSDGLLQTDASGVYTVQYVVETFDGHIPHYSNDLIGSDTYGAIEHWTETSSTDYYVYVGAILKRTFGIPPDQATLAVEIVGAASPWTAGGILTAKYSENRCPRWLSFTSDRAELVAYNDTMVALLATYYGKGYTGSSPIVDYSTEHAAATNYGYLATAFNQHLQYLNTMVHGAADATNPITASVGSTQASVEAFLASAYSKYEAHRVLTTSSTHSLADSVNSLSYAAPSGLAQCISAYNDFATEYGHHCANSGGHFHDDGTYEMPDDAPANQLTTTSLTSTATLAALVVACGDMKTKFNLHLASDLTLNYHAVEDTDNDATAAANVLGEADFPKAVNDLADLMCAHASNIKWSDKTSKGYHTAADKYFDRSRIPSANDVPSGLQVLEHLYALWYRHVLQTGTPWHAVVRPSGVHGSALLSYHGWIDIGRQFNIDLIDATLGTATQAMYGITSYLQRGFSK